MEITVYKINYDSKVQTLIDNHRTIKTKNNKFTGCDTEIEYLNKITKSSNLRWDAKDFNLNNAIHLNAVTYLDFINNEYYRFI